MFVLCCSLSFCFAGTGEEFKQDWTSSITILKNLKHKMDALQESDHGQYFAKEDVSERQLDRAKTLFRHSLNSTEHYLQDLVRTSQINVACSSQANEETTGKFAFQYYCLQLPIIKNLYDEQALAQPHSPYFTDLERCIESVNFYSKHFTLTEETMAYFSKIQPNGKRGGLKNYAVYFNENDWFFLQRRQVRSILSRLNQMDLDKLHLPANYKEYLQIEIEKIKKAISNIFKGPVISSILKEKSYQDLAAAGQTYTFSRPLTKNQLAIQYALGIAFNPFALNFTSNSHPEKISLSDEEQAISTNLLNQLLALNTLLRPTCQPKKGKVHPTKRKKGTLVKPQARTTKVITPIRVFSTIANDSFVSQDPVITLSELEKPESTLFVRDLVEQLIRDLPLPVQGEPSSSHDPMIEYPSQLTSSSSTSSTSSPHDPITRQEELENVSFVKKWLADIIKASQSNNGAFGVFQKAWGLASMIEKNPDLLEQIQEATAGLATRLQMLEQSSLIHPLSHKIPQNLESDFLYFMDTPIRYLKGLRFGLVSTLFENLDIKINRSMAGSRIHFSFRDKQGHYETSIHLHDKHNGELDGGRISSLRKFLIDCGFVYSETQNSPAKKFARRVGR